MQRFDNVDVFASLNALMRQNTGFYQSDLEIDKEIIARAAASPDAADKTLLWLSRPSGTYCFKERDVFLKDTGPHNTWRFHKEQTRDRILAYAIELTGVEDGKIRGNLYELDYAQHYQRVKEQAVPADMVRLTYAYGDREQPAKEFFDASPDPRLGKYMHYETLPNDPAALREVLQAEKHSRDALTPGDFKAHVAALHDGLIEHEARRIVERMKGLDRLNSPNKTHFMVELSPYFVQIASSKDTDRLFSMLPYKSLCFTGMKDRHGLYAVIGKDENRDKEVRRPRASIRRQLSETKQAQASKKAPARTKKNELEV